MHPALRRVVDHIGLSSDALVRFIDLIPSDRRALELEVVRVRASERPLGEVHRAFQASVDHQPSPVSWRRLHHLEGLALDALPDAFDTVRLSPLLPLGATTATGGTAPDLVLATTRDREVLSDPAVALALLAAARRADSLADIHLATTARSVRMQPLKSANHTRHFAMFAMASLFRAGARSAAPLDLHLNALLGTLAGVPGVGSVTVRFSDMGWLRRHLRTAGLCDDAFAERPDRLAERVGHLPRHTLDVPDSPVLRALAREWVPVLQNSHPNVVFGYDPGRIQACGYYRGLCFNIWVDGLPWGPTSIADGGLLDWGARLLNHGKERLLTSGLGLELLGHLTEA